MSKVFNKNATNKPDQRRPICPYPLFIRGHGTGGLRIYHQHQPSLDVQQHSAAHAHHPSQTPQHSKLPVSSQHNIRKDVSQTRDNVADAQRIQGARVKPCVVCGDDGGRVEAKCLEAILRGALGTGEGLFTLERGGKK